MTKEYCSPRSFQESREYETQEIPVVRVFPVAPISFDAFCHALEKDRTLSSTSLVEVILATTAVGDDQTEMVTPFGGKIGQGESVVTAALRDLGQDTTLITHSIGSTKRLLEEQKTIDPFLYTIPGEHIPRLTYCLVVPVRSSMVSSHSIRENKERPDDPKTTMIHVTPETLFEGFQTGVITVTGKPLPLLEHLVESDTALINNPEDRYKRTHVLQQITSDIGDVNMRWRRIMLERINHTRRFYRQYTSFHRPYASSFEDCTKEELELGFIAAQMTEALADEKMRDRDQKTKPSQAADMLKMVRFLSIVPPAYTLDLLLHVPTNESFYDTRLVRKALRSVIEGAFGEVKGYAPSRTSSTYELISTLWPEMMARSMAQRADMIDRFNERFLEMIGNDLGVSKETLVHAFHIAGTYPAYIADNMRSLGPQFQEYQPMNEVANASLFKLVLLGLGFHPDISVPQTALSHQGMEMVRFESLRTIALTITAVSALKRLGEEKNTLFESGLNTFLHFPPQPEIIPLGNGALHQVFHRSTHRDIQGRPIHLIVDERPKKTPESLMRKMLLESDVADIFSVNIALSRDNFSSSTISERIALSDMVSEALLGHIKHQLQDSGWDVSVVTSQKSRAAYDRLFTYLSLNEEERRLYMKTITKGKRPGSVGDLIIREKYILRFTRGDQQQHVEVCLYPFESVSSIDSLVGSGFMGLQEKIADDATGRYSAFRLISRDADQSCMPSLYELFYPPELYGWLMDRVKHHQNKKQM